MQAGHETKPCLTHTAEINYQVRHIGATVGSSNMVSVVHG